MPGAEASEKDQPTQAAGQAEPGTGVPAPPHIAPSSVVDLREPWRRCLWGIVIACVLGGVNQFVEHTRWGTDLRTMAYEQVHRGLKHTPTNVVVVNASAIQLMPGSDGEMETPRPALKNIAIALAEANAAGIGLDHDICRNGHMSKEDKDLLDALLAISEGSIGGRRVPVFVVANKLVPETLTREHPKLRRLLTSPDLLGRGQHGDYRRSAPTAIRSFTDNRDGEKVLGLSTALVEALHGPVPKGEPRWFPVWTTNVERGDTARYRERFLLDASGIDELLDTCIHLGKKNQPRLTAEECATVLRQPDVKRKIDGKIVLVGRADPDEHEDLQIQIPGRNLEVPGVYAHAMAVQTLRKGYLREVTPLGTIVFDVGVAALIMGALAGLEHFRLARGRPLRHRLTFLVGMSVVCILLTFYAAAFAARSFRIIWDGQAFVALAVLLHLLIDVVHHDHESAHADRKHAAK